MDPVTDEEIKEAQRRLMGKDLNKADDSKVAFLDFLKNNPAEAAEMIGGLAKENQDFSKAISLNKASLKDAGSDLQDRMDIEGSNSVFIEGKEFIHNFEKAVDTISQYVESIAKDVAGAKQKIDDIGKIVASVPLVKAEEAPKEPVATLDEEPEPAKAQKSLGKAGEGGDEPEIPGAGGSFASRIINKGADKFHMWLSKADSDMSKSQTKIGIMSIMEQTGNKVEYLSDFQKSFIEAEFLGEGK